VVVDTSGVQTGYYLHSNFLQSRTPRDSDVNTSWSENDSASLCSPCYGNLCVGKPTVPRFSIAAGYDFGYPLRLGLKPLSIVERKLIARNVLFATVVKLVGASGTNAQQHALKGHIIAMPHQGAQKTVEALPRLHSLSEMISVMFVGSSEQWRITVNQQRLVWRETKVKLHYEAQISFSGSSRCHICMADCVKSRW